MAKLLLIDDDLDMVDAFARVLHAIGHTIRVARDGRDGLAIVIEDRPDLILTDVEMPNLSGPGMALEILLHDAGCELIPILLMSGARDLTHVAAEVGTPYFLAKPFGARALIAKVNEALAERKHPLPHAAAEGPPNGRG